MYFEDFHFSNQLVDANKHGKHITSSTGEHLKLNLTQLLKDIDVKILGLHGKKDMGEHLDDKDLLNGFLDGYNEAEKEEIFYRLCNASLIFIVISLTFFSSYYVIFYIISFYWDTVNVE